MLNKMLERVVAVEADEVRPMLLSALYFFLVMAGYFVVRPLRDDMGLAGGVRNLPWLYTGTLVGMVLVHPIFAAMVSKLSRRRFISLSYHIVAALMIIFFVLLSVLGEAQIIWVGRAFWVFTSVFNLFVVSIFWSVMADVFKPGQGARIFGFIAVGGTAGAMLGSAVTASLAETIPTRFLLFASIALIEVAVLVALTLLRHSTSRADKGDGDRPAGDEVIGGSVMAGISAVFGSPYLLGIVGYMLLYTITSTFLYFEQAEIMSEVFSDRGARTAFFAKLDLAVNTLTIVTQIFLTGRIVRWFGIAFSLAWLPLVCVIGFFGLGFAPTLGVIAAFQIVRRASNYAVARPCREMLYTVLPREVKYKAKNFIDTFVYRAGDQVGAWSYAAMGWLGLGMTGIAFAAIPLAGAWLGIGAWLGRKQVQIRRTAEGMVTPSGPS
jgi:AAA family ATP:ADP antiporter